MFDVTLQPIVALIGHPVAGNPSQFMFEKAFAHHDLDWRFLTLDVAPDDLEQAIKGMRALGFAGGSFAEQYASGAVDHLDESEDPVPCTGYVDGYAVRDGRLVGFHAGGQAILDLVNRQELVAGKGAVVFGGGGIARTTAALLAQQHARRVAIVDPADRHRTDEWKCTLRTSFPAAQVFGGKDLTPDDAGEGYFIPDWADVVVNAMCDAPECADAIAMLHSLDWSAAQGDVILVDTCLDAAMSPFASEACPDNRRLIKGLEVLVERAIVSFRAWTGFEPDPAVLQDAVEEFLEL